MALTHLALPQGGSVSGWETCVQAGASGEGMKGAKGRVVGEGCGCEPQRSPEWVLTCSIFYFLVPESIKSRIKGTCNSHYLG